MKGVLLLISFSLILVLGAGCRTVPRHLAQEEVVIYYLVDYPILDDKPIGGPHPLPPSATPVINNPVPTRIPQHKNPDDGGSYNQRDPLQGDGKRQPRETKTFPPVKKPVKNDRAQ